MSNRLTELETDLKRRQNSYELNAAANSGFEKVKIALELGLSENVSTALGQSGRREGQPTCFGDEPPQTSGSGGHQPGPAGKGAGAAARSERQANPAGKFRLVRSLAAARGDYAEADRSWPTRCRAFGSLRFPIP